MSGCGGPTGSGNAGAGFGWQSTAAPSNIGADFRTRFATDRRPDASTLSSQFANGTLCLCIYIAFRLEGRIGTHAIAFLTFESREQTDDYYVANIGHGSR
jgi:hypothetical protein